MVFTARIFWVQTCTNRYRTFFILKGFGGDKIVSSSLSSRLRSIWTVEWTLSFGPGGFLRVWSRFPVWVLTDARLISNTEHLFHLFKLLLIEIMI